jgi:hypothetical protein
VPASDLFVLVLVVLCVAVVGWAALQSRLKTIAPTARTKSVDLEGSRIGSEGATSVTWNEPLENGGVLFG